MIRQSGSVSRYEVAIVGAGPVGLALGPHFTLLSLGTAQREADVFAAQAHQLGVPLRVVRDGADATRDFYASSLVLVRPDSFVAWADEDASGAKAVLERATGRSRRP